MENNGIQSKIIPTPPHETKGYNEHYNSSATPKQSSDYKKPESDGKYYTGLER